MFVQTKKVRTPLKMSAQTKKVHALLENVCTSRGMLAHPETCCTSPWPALCAPPKKALLTIWPGTVTGFSSAFSLFFFNGTNSNCSNRKPQIVITWGQAEEDEPIVVSVLLSLYSTTQLYYKAGTLQRYCTENWKKIFTERKLRGLSPNFYIHISASDLYIPTMVCLFGCSKIGGTDPRNI
jgi:hypothetical protein